jgi:hypothetical protein
VLAGAVGVAEISSVCFSRRSHRLRYLFLSPRDRRQHGTRNRRFPSSPHGISGCRRLSRMAWQHSAMSLWKESLRRCRSPLFYGLIVGSSVALISGEPGAMMDGEKGEDYEREPPAAF